MPNLENEQVVDSVDSKSKSFFRRTAVWLIPVIVIVIAAVSVTSYYVRSAWEKAEQERILQEQIRLESLEKEREQYEAARAEVVIDTFYEGIFIEKINLAGLSKSEASKMITDEINDRLDQIKYTITFEGQEWILTASDIEAEYDIEKVIEDAWKIGRISGAPDEKSKIYDRLEQINELKEEPVILDIPFNYDQKKVSDFLKSEAKNLEVEPVEATVTGFDIGSKKFIVSQPVNGLAVSADDVIIAIDNDLNSQNYQASYSLKSEVIPAAGSDLPSRVANLGLVSQATTYAATPDAPRDNNISLIAKALNGHVVLPGETFSFNEVVGRRTVEKGYQAAGAIFDGALVATVGGGICQPNTTLYQAALKADLKITERHPHTFPSSYTTVGLDSAIDWGSADMKFVNTTDYPLAIVCWYKKPEITFQIYGKPLQAGMTINLSAETTANEPPEEPIEQLIPELAPGTRNLKRAPHNMMRAQSYKNYILNGELIRTEPITASYYPPIRAIYEVGPPLDPSEMPPENPDLNPESEQIDPTVPESGEPLIPVPAPEVE